MLVAPTGLAGRGRINASFDEQDTGLRWLDGSKIYQTTYQMPGLPAGSSSISIAHNITGFAQFVNVWGMADNNTTFLLLPYAHRTQANNIGVALTDSQITINTGATSRVAYTRVFVTVQYTKTS